MCRPVIINPLPNSEEEEEEEELGYKVQASLVII